MPRRLAGTKPKMLPMLYSINELQMYADTNPRYERLAILAAENLGGPCRSLKESIQTLKTNASAVEYEGLCDDGEETLMDEVNAVRDCELDEFVVQWRKTQKSRRRKS